MDALFLFEERHIGHIYPTSFEVSCAQSLVQYKFVIGWHKETEEFVFQEKTYLDAIIIGAHEAIDIILNASS